MAEEVRGKDSTSFSKDACEGVHGERKDGEDDDTQQPHIRGCMSRRNDSACAITIETFEKKNMDCKPAAALSPCQHPSFRISCPHPRLKAYGPRPTTEPACHLSIVRCCPSSAAQRFSASYMTSYEACQDADHVNMHVYKPASHLASGAPCTETTTLNLT